MRASSALKRRSTGLADPLRCSSRAPVSRIIVSRSAIRRPGHCRERTPVPVSAMFGRLPCFGVWCTSSLPARRDASPAAKVSCSAGSPCVSGLSITGTMSVAGRCLSARSFGTLAKSCPAWRPRLDMAPAGRDAPAGCRVSFVPASMSRLPGRARCRPPSHEQDRRSPRAECLHAFSHGPGPFFLVTFAPSPSKLHRRPPAPPAFRQAASGSCAMSRGRLRTLRDALPAHPEGLAVPSEGMSAMSTSRQPPPLLRSPAAAGQLPECLPLMLLEPDPVDLPACGTRCPSPPDAFRSRHCPCRRNAARGHQRTARKTCCPLLSRAACKTTTEGKTGHGHLAIRHQFDGGRIVVSRIPISHQTSSLAPGSFILRQNRLTDARIPSADLTHLQGFGFPPGASMKDMMSAPGSATGR